MPQNFISRYNNLLAVKGLGSIEYTAGPNIDISDYVISGRDWTSDIDSAIEGVKGSGFSAATAWVDSQGYLTAHQDVDNLPYVQNSALEFYGVHISGISGSGLYALSAEGAFNAETANFAYNSESAESAGYAESAGITDSANYALTALFANSATSSLMADTAVYAYTADKADDLTNWTYTDSAMTGIKGYNGTAFISQDLQYWDYTDSAQTAISGYHGTAFTNDDINCPWISGNKVISPTQETYAGQEFQVISSFDFSGNKNHFISLKGMVLKFPSTAHIASALYEKFDTTAFNNFITNGFNPQMTELHGDTAYISAFVNTGCVHNSALESTEEGLISSISGSGFYADGGGDTTPWISGDKVIDPELLLNFGDAVQMISSFNVSGFKNHAIALKGRQLKLPSTAHIQSALDEKLDISSFSSYTANASDRMDGIFQLANSAYTTAVNNFYNKADKSAISSWSGDINYLSGQIDQKLDSTAFNTGDFYPMTGNPSGFLTAVDLSDYAKTEDLTAYYPNSNPSGFITGVDLSEYQEKSGMTAYQEKGDYYSASNPSGFITGVDLSDYANSADVTGTAQYALTTAGWTEVTAAAEGDYELSAGEGISITDYPEEQKTVIAVTAGGTEYSAGQYIKISGNEISVTGLQPAGSYQPAGNYVTYADGYGNQSAGWKQNGTFNSTGEFVAMTTGNTLPYILLSGNGAGSKSAYLKIDSDGVHIYSGDAWQTAANITYGKYTAGPNISINASNGISGKDWTNTITAASAYAASMATGKEYTGVAPIVVNNAEDKISANTMELIAGNGIEFVTASTSTTINCTAAGGGGMNVTDGTSSYSALGFYEQVADTGCFQIMGTANGGTTPGNSFGYTLPMQARSFSSDCVDSAKNYTDAEISAHIKYVSYGALAGGTVTFADVRSAILDGGIVIPYEVKLPGNNYFVYNYTRSGIDNLTTGYDFTRYDAGGNCVTLTVSSYNNGATTGCVTGIQKVFATPSDVAAVDRIVLVAASGDIPASGSSDNKVYIVTGS